MIILAAAIVITLSNSGIINKANEAVEKTNLKQAQELAQVIWAEGYLHNKDEEEIKGEIIAKLGDAASKYDIIVRDKGVIVVEKIEDEDFDLIQRYFLGENKTGRLVTEIINTTTGKLIDEE